MTILDINLLEHSVVSQPFANGVHLLGQMTSYTLQDVFDLGQTL